MKYELTTSSAQGSGYFAKVITIPKQSTVYINTFNMIFEVYHISAWSEPMIEKYGISLMLNSVRLTKFPQLGNAECNNGNTVGYVVNTDDIDIYVKSNTQDACVYLNVLGVSSTDISIKHDFANFIDVEPEGIVYATLKSNIIESVIESVNDIESRLHKSNVARTISGARYHTPTTCDVTLPENRGYFGVISDGSSRIAFVNISTSGSVSIHNIVGTISASYDSSTKILSFTGLGDQRFLYYMFMFSF